MPAELDRAFAALADPTRRSVIRLLKAEPRRASEIADALGATRPATSKHLRVLKDAGLVEEGGLEEDARVRVYRLRRKPFVELRSWLDDVEGFWTAQLASFQAHVAARARKR
jgi:DNA-binding transcriptional ArsR family regulator